jgi:hypothetical protein
MSKFFKKIETAISNINNTKYKKGLIITSIDQGIAIGIYIENLPQGVRVWDFLFPIYHGNLEITFQYSKISKFNFVSDNMLLDENDRIIFIEKFKSYIKSICNIKYISFIKIINDMDIDELSKIRFNLLFHIYSKRFELCLSLKEKIISENICQFDWWKDTQYIWGEFSRNPNHARNILLNREKAWLDAISHN